MNGNPYKTPRNTNNSSYHALLEQASPKYSDSTVRRAFIVWLRCGQRNKFRDVCNFYHHLETFEATMSPSMRAASRQHELDLFKKEPPMSPYLQSLFPNLYTKDMDQYLQEVKDKDDRALLQEFDRRQEVAANSEVVQASGLIRNYCLATKKSLADFLFEFKEHTRKCGLLHNVFNVMFYIRRQSIDCELKNIFRKEMNSTKSIVRVEVTSDFVNTQYNNEISEEHTPLFNIAEETRKISILTNESKRTSPANQLDNK